MHLVAALSWDPQLRGALIFLTAVLVLPGSVYLLLATNTGARLGFLLAVAGLSGWLFALNVIWMSYGIGYKGTQPSWVVKEIVTGPLDTQSTIPVITGTPPGNPLNSFPNPPCPKTPGGTQKPGNSCWRTLPLGNPVLAPASPVADKALIPPPPGAKASTSFPPPFKTTQDYVILGGWDKGGQNYLVNLFGYKVFVAVGHHQLYIRHQPHWLVIKVQPSLPSVTLAGGAATLPAADATKPTTSVVMEKDQGSLRLPPILLGTAALIIFGLTCERLHRRDKEIQRRKEEEEREAKSGRGPDQPGGTRPAGELQPA